MREMRSNVAGAPLLTVAVGGDAAAIVVVTIGGGMVAEVVVTTGVEVVVVGAGIVVLVGLVGLVAGVVEVVVVLDVEAVGTVGPVADCAALEHEERTKTASAAPSHDRVARRRTAERRLGRSAR
jgi:hypothetical protein